jgi:hypothetical protein
VLRDVVALPQVWVEVVFELLLLTLGFVLAAGVVGVVVLWLVVTDLRGDDIDRLRFLLLPPAMSEGIRWRKRVRMMAR